MRTTEIHKRRILDNDENTMNHVKHIMSHIHFWKQNPNHRLVTFLFFRILSDLPVESFFHMFWLCFAIRMVLPFYCSKNVI